MYMTRVSSSELKAKMGQYMRAVRAGQEVVVTDRDRPVARLVPFEAPLGEQGVQVSQPRDPAAPPLGALDVRARPYKGTDTTALLREDRARR
jgi:prevent-host-death family protein